MSRTLISPCIAVGTMLLTVSLCRADLIGTLTMDTTPFQSLPSGDTVTIAMSFTDGSNGDGVSNNTVIITQLKVVGGSLDSGSTTPSGTVTISPIGGDLTDTVTMKDSSSLNAISENYTTVGASLSFNIDLTTNVSNSENLRPDGFGFTILDSQGLINYNNSTTSDFLDIALTGPSPNVSRNGGSITDGPDIGAPTFTFASVPEPSTMVLMLTGAAFAGAGSVRRRFGARKG